ncbi:MAG: hypothetical protein GY853_16870 [PVC group bacterium]|nr:hypothetical protein [PVC group bacterium]
MSGTRKMKNKGWKATIREAILNWDMYEQLDDGTILKNGKKWTKLTSREIKDR